MPNSQVLRDRQKAQHGEFFFTKFILPDTGTVRKSPVFVLSNPADLNDDDVIVCKCTCQGPKSSYDVKVQLKHPTYIRTNKIFTISRNNLIFKIRDYSLPEEQYNEIIKLIKEALYIKQE